MSTQTLSTLTKPTSHSASDKITPVTIPPITTLRRFKCVQFQKGIIQSWQVVLAILKGKINSCDKNFIIKSSPKIKKTMVKICVEKKKQFFKALYEAIEDGIEVINNSEVTFPIKDNRGQSKNPHIS